MTRHRHTVAKTTGKEEQTTKQRSETRSARDSHHHGLPVVFTTAYARGGMVVLSGTHDRASPSAPDLCFSFVPFRFPARFSELCCEFAFKKDVFGFKNDTIQLIHHSPSSFSFSLD